MFFGIIVACLTTSNECKPFSGPFFYDKRACEQHLAFEGVSEIKLLYPNLKIVDMVCYKYSKPI